MLQAGAGGWQLRPARLQRRHVGDGLEAETLLPGVTLVGPRLEQLDLLRRQRIFLVWHADGGVGAADTAIDLALAALAGDDVFRPDDRFAAVEGERAFVGAVGVALGAAGLEQRQ